MNFKEYQKEYKQIYAGRWSLLTCAYLGYKHTKIIKDKLGFGLNTNIIISRKGFCASYYEEKDFERFGKKLAEKVADNISVIKKWSDTVKKLTDDIKKLIKELRKKPITLEGYNKFLAMFYDYVAPYVAVKQAANFVPKEIAEKILPLCTEVRKYAETLYTETEKFMIYVSNEISKKTGYNPEHILTMVKEEFDNYLKTGKLPGEYVLKKRYDKSALIFDEGSYELIVGNNVDELEKIMLGLGKITSLKGNTAFPGKAKGKVRIIFNPKKAAKFDDGDVLVTGMTRPDFVPLMEKAAAIVTDAGGILCHAAIVARELKKPTIIGTEKATKVFKDGDLVEIDAEKGIIKKIKR